MDAVSRVFAAPTTLSLGGREFRVEARLAKHYAEIADRLLSQRPNPLEVARRNLALFDGSPEIQDRLLSIAMAEATRAKSVTWAEMSEYLNSQTGRAS